MANEITINTDWGEPGHQLTGAQVQAFIKKSLTDLNTTSSSNTQAINQLNENVAQLDTTLEEVNNNVNTHSASIVTLEGNMEQAQTQINDHLLRINGLGAALTGKSMEIEQNTNDITELRNQIQTISESELDNLVTRANFTAMMNQPACLYNVVSTDGCKTGTMVMFSDSMHHTVTQCLISFYFLDAIPGSGAHSQKIHIIWRCWSRDAVHGPMNSWSEWESLIPELTDTTGNDRNKPISQYGATRFFKSLCDKMHVPYTTDPTTGQITITD